MVSDLDFEKYSSSYDGLKGGGGSFAAVILEALNFRGSEAKNPEIFGVWSRTPILPTSQPSEATAPTKLVKTCSDSHNRQLGALANRL